MEFSWRAVFKYYEHVFFNLFYQFVYLFSHWPSCSSFKFPAYNKKIMPSQMFWSFFLLTGLINIYYFSQYSPCRWCCFNMMLRPYPAAIYSSASVIPTEKKTSNGDSEDSFHTLFCLSGFVTTSVLHKSCSFGFTCTFYWLKAKRSSSFYLETSLNPKALLRHCIIWLHADHVTIKWPKRHTRGFLGSFSIIIMLLEYF